LEKYELQNKILKFAEEKQMDCQKKKIRIAEKDMDYRKNRILNFVRRECMNAGR